MLSLLDDLELLLGGRRRLGDLGPVDYLVLADDRCDVVVDSSCSRDGLVYSLNSLCWRSNLCNFHAHRVLGAVEQVSIDCSRLLLRHY